MLDQLYDRWWRVGGVFGILFLILFIVGIALQGDAPDFDAPTDEIRDWFADNGEQYLVADYLVGLAFVLFFLPFLASLRGVLAAAEGGAGIWSRVAFAGGLVLLVLGAVAGVFWSALAFGFGVAEEGEEGTIRTLMYLDRAAYATLPMAYAPFLLGSSIVIARTGVLWRWLAILGLIGAVLGPLAGLSGLESDPEGGFSIFWFITGPVVALWFLLVSVNMIVKSEAPAAA